MEERYGVRGTELDGVFFTESSIAGAHRIRHLDIEISRQNANLFEVKRRLAEAVRASGGNALTNFQYGQRAHNWLDLVFSFRWDSESWHGEGDAVRVDSR